MYAKIIKKAAIWNQVDFNISSGISDTWFNSYALYIIYFYFDIFKLFGIG